MLLTDVFGVGLSGNNPVKCSRLLLVLIFIIMISGVFADIIVENNSFVKLCKDFF